MLVRHNRVSAFQNAIGAFHGIFGFEIEIEECVQSVFEARTFSGALRFEILDAPEFFFGFSINSQRQFAAFVANRFYIALTCTLFARKAESELKRFTSS